MKTVVIFGGSGFIGQNIIRRISKNGYKIIVPHQKQINEAKLKLLGTTGQIIPIRFNSLKEEKILKLINHSDIVLNLKTLWDEKRISYIKGILNFNIDLVNIVKKNKLNEQFIYFSGVGIDQNTNSPRSTSIFESEKYINKNLPNSIIIRPGVIIGGGDQFLRGLIPLFKMSFFIPLFGNGLSKFQPVYIDDISMAINKIIRSNLVGNQTFELTGNEIFSYKEFYQHIASCMNKTRVFVPIPLRIMRIIISLLEKTPFSPLNLEQLSLFEKDNVSSNNYKKFEDLDLYAQDIREIIKNIINKIYNY